MQPNGQMPVGQRDAIQDKLVGEPLTEGYKPTLPLWALWITDTIPQFYLTRDIELMIFHPVVLNALNFFKAGISGAQFVGPIDPADPTGQASLPISENQEVAGFVTSQCRRFWDYGVPLAQGGYEYGWIGCENLYTDKDGPLAWDKLLHFSPRDCYLLTQNSRPIAVRVKNIVGPHPLKAEERPSINPVQEDYRAPKGSADLWLAEGATPAKGLWYVHNSRYNAFYGQSQLLGAWRPWRRLAWRDGGETVLDGGFYRAAYSGPTVRYPEEDLQGKLGAPATTLDSQGNPRRYGRDMARMMAEQAKAGASIGMPSTQYPPELGGGNKWDFDWPETKFDGGPLLEYVKYLMDQIRHGIGVPPELLAAAETGSGYSGRAIPLEGFMQVQQRLANHLLSLFVEQVLRPLVLWNYGPVKWTVRVADLLTTKQQGRQQQGGADAAHRAGPGAPAVPGQPGAEPKPSEPLAEPQSGMFSMQQVVFAERVREIARRVLRRAA